MRDPIWAVLEHQGRNLKWLARVTGYKYSYVRALACGVHPPSGEFRRRCAKALDMPESLLFLPATSTVVAERLAS